MAERFRGLGIDVRVRAFLGEIGNVLQIDRGYERIDERLRDLGARISRLEDAPVPA